MTQMFCFDVKRAIPFYSSKENQFGLLLFRFEIKKAAHPKILTLVPAVPPSNKAQVSVATVLDSIPASPDRMESEGRQMKYC
jgi:hypothetical protein